MLPSFGCNFFSGGGIWHRVCIPMRLLSSPRLGWLFWSALWSQPDLPFSLPALLGLIWLMSAWKWPPAAAAFGNKAPYIDSLQGFCAWYRSWKMERHAVSLSRACSVPPGLLFLLCWTQRGKKYSTQWDGSEKLGQSLNFPAQLSRMDVSGNAPVVFSGFWPELLMHKWMLSWWQSPFAHWCWDLGFRESLTTVAS